MYSDDVVVNVKKKKEVEDVRQIFIKGSAWFVLMVNTKNCLLISSSFGIENLLFFKFEMHF